MLITTLENVFNQHANAEIAHKQAAYMKNISLFLGLPKPLRAALQKPIFKAHRLNASQLKETVLILWNKEEREYCYAALDLLLMYKKVWTPDYLDLFDEMTQIKPWWDTIDIIAAHCVGHLLKQHPVLKVTMDRWIHDKSLWKRRVALLYQLRYKSATDHTQLVQYYKITMHEREFFIAKAIGWSLREYSKTNPVWVKNFIEEHKQHLARLSIREGGKYC